MAETTLRSPSTVPSLLTTLCNAHPLHTADFLSAATRVPPLATLLNRTSALAVHYADGSIDIALS